MGRGRAAGRRGNDDANKDLSDANETTMIIANGEEDDDSFGPAPPPPSHPHPDDLSPPKAGGSPEGRAHGGDYDDAAALEGDDGFVPGESNSSKKKWSLLGFGKSRAGGRGPGADEPGVQIQGIDDVLKDEPPPPPPPPAANEEGYEEGGGAGGGAPGQRQSRGRFGRFGGGGGGGRGGRDDTEDGDDEDDNEIDEDMSVEIPPTTVVQRMKHREENDEVKRLDNGKWGRVGMAAGCLLVVLAVVLGVGYGTGAFQQSSSRSGSGGNGGGGGGGSSDPNRPAAVTSYLQSITTEPGAYFGNGTANATDPGTLSANWLINDDPLQLSPDTGLGKFRLRQRYALLTLWYASRSYWANATGWATGDDECTWLGVTCEPAQLDGEAGDVTVVTRLSLDGNGVQALPSDLFLLDSLKVLSLADNEIVGTIPPSLANATTLVELYLEKNGLEQDLSDFDWSGLANLEVLRLGENRGLNGTVHDSLWTLAKLQELALNGCRFRGEIGAAPVDSLQSLAVFDISKNRGGDRAGFSGALPTVLAAIPTLEVVGLGGNRFEGTIPPEYAASLPALSEMDLSDNQLTGSLLEDWGASTALRVLRVGGNAGLGGGSIPAFLYDMTSLQVLDIGGMTLDGPIDPAIANLASLVEFNVSGNALTGAPPTEIGTLSSLQVLGMGSNFLSGPLGFVSGLASLTDLNVETNLFTGFSDLSGLTGLRSLRASRNDFRAAFPDAVTSLPSLGTSPPAPPPLLDVARARVPTVPSLVHSRFPSFSRSVPGPDQQRPHRIPPHQPRGHDRAGAADPERQLFGGSHPRHRFGHDQPARDAAGRERAHFVAPLDDDEPVQPPGAGAAAEPPRGAAAQRHWGDVRPPAVPDQQQRRQQRRHGRDHRPPPGHRVQHEVPGGAGGVQQPPDGDAPHRDGDDGPAPVPGH
jgi:Leucine-rich repeat (LRR) protein